MPSFEIQKYVEHHRANMFALVADVESYPEFLPMCEALSIRSYHREGENSFFLADMTVHYQWIREILTTKVSLHPGEGRIKVQYVEGPFQYLENYWIFLPVKSENACIIEFFIDYKISHPIFSLIAGQMFRNVFCRFIDIFKKRADELYDRVI
ncbi:MAG: Cyclase/dehydrase [Candidatus Tokpelaia sp. JSC161]|jgi:coenzyme Q-binding protein COQ10|nr:MAG: Cyclase/dehydrase [Candidatus Tokpelaia sp. JSC161]